MFQRILLTAALILTAHAAMATRARLTSLQGGSLNNGTSYADHVVDEQTVFQYPSRINVLNPSLMFEMGAAGTDAEGGVLKKLSNDGRLLVYMGRDFTRPDVLGTDLRNGYIVQQNPLDVIYGKGDFAFGATLSMIDNKQSKTKEQTLVLRGGKALGNGEVFASLDLLSSAEKAGTGGQDKITGAPYLMVGGNGNSGDYHFYGQFHYGDSKSEPATGASTKIKDMNFLLGLEDRSMKSSGSDIYYGTSLIIASRDYEGKKISGTLMPIFLGTEYDINSWSVLRASVRQNFLLIGTTKNETTAGDSEGVAANTTVAAGLGFKYNKLQLDGTLQASTTGQINGSSMLAQAGLVYYY